jgi:thiol-disulfide isomerase/thioredoxin
MSESVESKSGKPVFVIVTAQNCGHCHRFSNTYPQLADMIRNTGLVEVIELKLPSISSVPNPDIYPLDIQRYIKWYPTFILFPGRVWNHALTGKNNRLDGVVFNGRVFNDEVKHFNYIPETKNMAISLTPDNLIAWIRSELDTPLFRNSESMDKLPYGMSDQQKTIGLKPTNSKTIKNNEEIYIVPTSGSFCHRNKYRAKNVGN